MHTLYVDSVAIVKVARPKGRVAQSQIFHANVGRVEKLHQVSSGKDFRFILMAVPPVFSVAVNYRSTTLSLDGDIGEVLSVQKTGKAGPRMITTYQDTTTKLSGEIYVGNIPCRPLTLPTRTPGHSLEGEEAKARHPQMKWPSSSPPRVGIERDGWSN